MSDKYKLFLANRNKGKADAGFDPDFMPDSLFGFQKSLVEWSCRKGRSAIFADCGLGKTRTQLTWAQNVIRRENKPVLVLTPLAVGPQTISEAEQIGVYSSICRDGKHGGKPAVVVANYERLHYFNPSDFSGIVCDESSILKNYAGKIREDVTEFVRRIKYRLLCTATPAPNDYMELGTSSEALGVLRRVEMLAQYFVHDGGDTGKWRIKGHAAKGVFWKWVSTWAKACRMPSDLGFSDDGYSLPPMTTNEHVVESEIPAGDMLFKMNAVTLDEQREERKRTIKERCEKVAELVNTREPALCFVHMNDESAMLKRMIADSIEISGSDCDEEKEEKFNAFTSGHARVLVTKPKIAGVGLNFQHCAHQTYFPSHSFEQMYQGVRRSWRFGQKRPVTIDIVTSQGESGVMKNLERKMNQYEEMFKILVGLMAA